MFQENGNGTREAILGLRLLIVEKRIEINRPKCIAFIGREKGFGLDAIGIYYF